jgi:uncharacterized membrane protein (UPF0127 family)
VTGTANRRRPEKKRLVWGVGGALFCALVGWGAVALWAEKPEASFGGVSLKLEYATTSAAQERGLSGRSQVPSGYGMLFVFDHDDRYVFWMKDMLVPIDIFWLDDKGQLIFTTAELATSTFPNVFYPPVPVRYVLETESGFARQHHIATGTPLLLKSFPTVLK